MNFDRMPAEKSTESPVTYEKDENASLFVATLDVEAIPEDVTLTDNEKVAKAVIDIAKQWSDQSGESIENFVFCAYEGFHEDVVRAGAAPENDNDGAIYASNIDQLRKSGGDSAIMHALTCAGDEPHIAVYDREYLRDVSDTEFLPEKKDYKSALVGIIKVAL